MDSTTSPEVTSMRASNKCRVVGMILYHVPVTVLSLRVSGKSFKPLLISPDVAR